MKAKVGVALWLHAFVMNLTTRSEQHNVGISNVRMSVNIVTAPDRMYFSGVKILTEVDIYINPSRNCVLLMSSAYPIFGKAISFQM